MGTPPYVPAKWKHVGRSKAIRAVCMHVTVSKELGTGAEQVAKYFQTSTRPGSSHLVGDNDSVVRCVLDGDTAFGAAGLNSDGLHYELVGMPDQTAGEWADDYSLDELELAAYHVAGWCREHEVPARWLTVAQLRDKVSRGLTTHADVEEAFPSTGHWDPGPNFPRDYFLGRVLHHLGGAPTPGPTPPDQGDDEVPSQLVRDPNPGLGGQIWLVSGDGIWKNPITVGAEALANLVKQHGPIQTYPTSPPSAAAAGIQIFNVYRDASRAVT